MPEKEPKIGVVYVGDTPINEDKVERNSVPDNLSKNQYFKFKQKYYEQIKKFRKQEIEEYQKYLEAQRNYKASARKKNDAIDRMTEVDEKLYKKK